MIQVKTKDGAVTQKVCAFLHLNGIVNTNRIKSDTEIAISHFVWKVFEARRELKENTNLYPKMKH